MKSPLTIFLNLALVCSLSFVLPLSGIARQQGGVESTHVQRDDSLALSVRYGILFRRLAGVQSGSQESGTPGKTNESHYADLLQREVSLSDEQTRALLEIAGECQRRVAEVDASAKAMIDASRAQSSGGQPPGLAALQQERNSIILQAREKLRTAFGEEAFQRFDNYVASHGSGRTFTLPPAGRSAVPLQATITALSADRQIEQKQFRVGEKIVIQISLLNNSSLAISVRQADLYDWFELSRIEGSIREPIFMQPPEKEAETAVAETKQKQDVELLPGQQTVVGAFDLSKIQKLLKPGRYMVAPHPHVLLNRPPDKSEFINLTSNDDPVTFEVVP